MHVGRSPGQPQEPGTPFVKAELEQAACGPHASCDSEEVAVGAGGRGRQSTRCMQRMLAPGQSARPVAMVRARTPHFWLNRHVPWMLWHLQPAAPMQFSLSSMSQWS